MDTGFNEVAHRLCGPKKKEIMEIRGKLKNINLHNLIFILKYYNCDKKGE